MIEVQIILVVSERILDLLTGDEESEEDKACENRSGDRDPSQQGDNLERKSEDIEPCDDP